uniref:Inner membrane protein n=1 Tax=Syphacia muris TaxID=451379 RepID=A0A0N5A7Y7_9BILA
MDIWHDGALIFLSNWPKLLNIAFVIIAGITGVMGTLLNRPTFILLFLFIQAVILFYIVSVALIMILTAIVMDGTFDKLLFITNINFGVTYGVLLYMVYKYWRQVSRTYLPRLHKTITVKKTHIRFSNEFLPMTPEIRIHNPVREVELVVPNSPTLPLYTDSFRSDESPVLESNGTLDYFFQTKALIFIQLNRKVLYEVKLEIERL